MSFQNKLRFLNYFSTLTGAIATNNKQQKQAIVKMKTKLRTLCFLFAFVVTFSMYNVWKSLQVLEESPLAWQLDWQKTGQSTTAKAKKGFKQAESSIEKDLSTSAKESQDDRLAQSRFRRKNAPKKKSNTISALKSLGAEDAREQPKTTVEKQPEDSGSDGIPDYAKAWSNITTFAFYEARLRSGYRNQMMAFTVLIMECLRQGHGQFLMETVSQKDTYGSNKPINFWELWDIEHWNSFYPALPRLVRFDPDLHDQYDVETSRWYRTDEGNWTDRMQSKYYNKPTRPIPYGKQHLLMTAYIRYSQGAGVYTTSDGHRNPAELLMLRQAMRPHPDLQKIIDSLLQSLLPGGHNSTIEYMTLHARVVSDTLNI